MKQNAQPAEGTSMHEFAAVKTQFIRINMSNPNGPRSSSLPALLWPRPPCWPRLMRGAGWQRRGGCWWTWMRGMPLPPPPRKNFLR